jgi:glycosyltransferase involved in cell wall biosynthesis
MPSVAVAITTYNQSRWIGQTLASVFGQSVAPSEVVVLDDGSTDGTPAILGQFRDRVRIIRQPNAGVAAARNAAVRACSADFVALLDGDDLWHPQKLQRCTELLKIFNGAVLLAHDVEKVSADARSTLVRGQEIGALLARHGQRETGLVDCIGELLSGDVLCTTSQVVVRRSAYIDVGMSDSSFRIASDYDLYLRLALRGPFLLSREVLAQWRQHEESASGAGLERSFNWAVDIARVLHKARRRHDMKEHTRAIDQRQSAIVRDMYRLEQTCGRWPTSRALARIAWSCGSPYSAFAAGAVLLTPEWLRRSAATATGVTMSTK